jgi:hypothetical protein
MFKKIIKKIKINKEIPHRLLEWFKIPTIEQRNIHTGNY